MEIIYRPIGYVRSPFKEREGTPIQPVAAAGIEGEIELSPEFAEGLKDLEGFSHVIILFHFHRVGEARLAVTPFLDDQPRGVFATRAPVRPNPIGLSILKLLAVEGSILRVSGVDLLDGTPVLDIKPYVAQFDRVESSRSGWIEHVQVKIAEMRADGRFR